MNHRLAQQHFDIRFLKWALNQANIELESGFQSFQSFKYGSPLRMVEFLRRYEREERMSAWMALIKWRQSRQRGGEPGIEPWQNPTNDENAIAEQYLSAIRKCTEPEIMRESEEEDSPELFKFERRLLIRRIREAMEPVFGPAEKHGLSSELRYKVPVENVRLVTCVDVGGRFHQVTYRQSVEGPESVELKQSIAILSWLGCSGQTDWSHLRYDEIDDVALALTEFCSRFHRALPELVNSLPGLQE
jgi:hypothetical protein